MSQFNFSYHTKPVNDNKEIIKLFSDKKNGKFWNGTNFYFLIIRKRILECEMKFVKIEFSNQFAECCVKGANYNLPGCRPLRQATKNMSKCLRKAELWTGKRRMVRFIFRNILGEVWISYDEFLTGIFQCSKTDSVMLIQLIQNCITTKSDKMLSTRPVFEKPSFN